MKRVITVFILIMVCSFTLKAQNQVDALRLSVPGLGASARALGMGNAYTALSDDFSSSFFNPAGLAYVNRFEFAGSLNYNNFNNNAGLYGFGSEYSVNSTNLNQVGFVFPIDVHRGSLVFSLGYNKTKDFNSATDFSGYNSNNHSMIQFLTGTYNEVPPITFDVGVSYEVTDGQGNYLRDETIINGDVRQSGNILQEGSINSWVLTGAAEIAKDVFLGASFNIYSGTYKNDREYYEDDIYNIYQSNTDPNDPTTNDFQSFFLTDIIDWELEGWDFKVGLLYQFEDIARFGGSVKFPTKYSINESYYLDASADFGTGVTYQIASPIIDEIEYDITTPFEFSAGAAVNVASLILSGDIKFIDYTQMEFTDGLDEFQRRDINKNINEIFTAVLNYNLGFEYNLPVFPVRLRGGFIYVPSAYKNDPSEFDRKYLTAGLGFVTGKQLSLDFAYTHGWWKDIRDNYDSGLSRITEDIASDNFIISVTYRY